MIFNHFFIGILEDNTFLFVLPRLIGQLSGCTEFIKYPDGLCQNLVVNNQPLIFIYTFLIAKLLDPILAYNLVVLGGVVLNLFFAFRFFKKLFERFIAISLAIILITSPYLAYQSRSHLDLMQFWPVIWFLDVFFFSKSRHKAVFLGLLLTLIIGISNYLGYFTLLFTVLYTTLVFLMRSEKRVLIKSNYKGVIKGGVVFILSSLIFLAPYIKSNFFVPKTRAEDNTDFTVINRPFGDFITFSSRPWYYLLPSVDNPFFGGLSQKFLNRLSSGGNYLTQNYFKAEHSASYLGWLNLTFALVGIVFLFRYKKEVPFKVSALLLSIFGLIVLTMPPTFSLHGSEFYTPSYILFKIFPMFRVLARAGILILFLTLIFTGYGYLALVKLASNRKIKPLVIWLVLAILALFSVVEFFIPLKITHVRTSPKVYLYIGTTVSQKSPIVVYPYNKTNGAIFWITTYNQPLINPRFYENKPTGFVSEDFTNLLNTASGLEKAQELGAKYLVYFYIDDNSKNTVFFENSSQLVRVADFIETDPDETQILSFIRVIEAGTTASNSATLYKFK